MTLEEAESVTDVWPDNIAAVNLFISLSTQWRVGMSGATGLDYNALPVVMRMQGIKQADRAELFETVRTMEDAALAQMQANK